MKGTIGITSLIAGVLLLAAPAAGVSVAASPTSAADRVVVQTVMDERAKKSTGRAKVWAPGLETWSVDIRKNRTVVTKVGRDKVIASRTKRYPRKAFRLKPGTYRFTTAITYRTPAGSTRTISRTQRVKVLKPATGTCIYMVRNGDKLAEPGDEFMIWHKVRRTVHGVIGGFQSEYADLRLKFTTRRTKASGSIFLYPTGEQDSKSFRVKGKSNRSYSARGWSRVATSTWRAEFPRKLSAAC